MTLQRSILLSGFVLLLAGCNNHEAPTKEASVQDSIPIRDTNAGIPKTSEKDIKFETYCNSKFGYCIDYPSDLLVPQGEAGNGDGQAFTSENGENTLLVYRDFRDNMDPEIKFMIEMAYKDDIESNSKKPKTISYKKSGKNFFVISGHTNGKIFYQKTIVSEEQLVTSIIEYKATEKEVYDKVSERIFKSFK